MDARLSAIPSVHCCLEKFVDSGGAARMFAPASCRSLAVPERPPARGAGATLAFAHSSNRARSCSLITESEYSLQSYCGAHQSNDAEVFSPTHLAPS